MKIAILGYSGSGKSTLAKYISNEYNLPLLYLDTLHWLPGWKERDNDEEIKFMKDFLDKNESWVIDGNYSQILRERRLEEADMIIFLNFNRFSCLNRAIKRKKEFNGKSRDSLTPGCTEKIDISFVWWILFQGRTFKIRNKYKEFSKKYASKFVTIKNQKQLDKFYTKVKEHNL